MFRQGIKNFFINLKYFFTPLGSMFLGMMIGISFLVPGVIQSGLILIDGVKALGENLHLDFGEVWNTLWKEIVALNWESPNQAIETIFSEDWLNQQVTNTLSVILGKDFELFKMEIGQLVSEFVKGLQLSVIVFIAWWIMGFLVGYILLRFLVRRTIAKRNLWQYILNIFVNSLLVLCMLVICLVLFTIWAPSILLSYGLMLLLSGSFSLLGAYLVYGRKKISFRKVMNFKNLSSHFLANLCILLIALTMTILAVIVNILLGIFTDLSLLAIAFLVMNMNAESYVIHMVKKEEAKF